MTTPASPAHAALAAWEALRTAGGERGALVTLVRADGGAARSVGTHFGLAEDGRAYGSVTIGGCADGRALEAAARALRTGERELVTVPLGEEDAVALGLGCAGDVELLIEPVALAPDDASCRALEGAALAMGRGVRAAVVTPLEGSPGRLTIADDGACAGTTGSAERDAVAAALGAAALHEAGPVSDVRTAAGGRWLVELLAPPRAVLVVGATDVAAALCVLAVPLGWRVVLIDPRDAVLGEPRFDAAAERRGGMPVEVLAERMQPGDAVVVVAHDYKVERPVLRAALRSGASYVGMLGSRKRGAAMRALLTEDGATPAELERLRTPIGLPIGAQGAGEIAVSIVAELIATWRGGAAAREPRT
jgi:xanthine dehydrogenase accessory factor